MAEHTDITNGAFDGFQSRSNGQSLSAVLKIAALKPNGSLKEYESFNLTPEIGTEFRNTDLAEILRAENSNDLIHDLAILSIPPYHL